MCCRAFGRDMVRFVQYVLCTLPERFWAHDMANFLVSTCHALPMSSGASATFGSTRRLCHLPRPFHIEGYVFWPEYTFSIVFNNSLAWGPPIQFLKGHIVGNGKQELTFVFVFG